MRLSEHTAHWKPTTTPELDFESPQMMAVVIISHVFEWDWLILSTATPAPRTCFSKRLHTWATTLPQLFLTPYQCLIFFFFFFKLSFTGYCETLLWLRARKIYLICVIGHIHVFFVCLIFVFCLDHQNMAVYRLFIAMFKSAVQYQFHTCGPDDPPGHCQRIEFGRVEHHISDHGHRPDSCAVHPLEKHSCSKEYNKSRRGNCVKKTKHQHGPFTQLHWGTAYQVKCIFFYNLDSRQCS